MGSQPTTRDVRDQSARNENRTNHRDKDSQAGGKPFVHQLTLARTIRLEAKDFNEYLATEVSPAILLQRRKTGEDTSPARERYSKHVKALLQVGGTHSSNYGAVLGYPAEVVPVNNPYALGRGEAFHVRALVEGKPEAGQLLYYGGRKVDGTPVRERCEVHSHGQGSRRHCGL